MVRKSILLTLLIVVLVGSGAGTAGNLLSLDEAILMAIQTNPTLQSNQLDQEKAVSDLNLAWRNLFPQAKLQSSYTRLEEGIPQPTGEYDFVEVGQYPVNIPGGTIPFPIVVPIPTYEEGSPNMFNTQLTLQQPVFMGGKVMMGIEMAKKGMSLAEINGAKVLNETVYNVIQTYYNVLMVQEMIQIQESGLTLIEEHQRLAKANYEAGLMLKKDLLNVEIEKRKAVQQLKMTQNQLHLAEKRFAQLLGVDQFAYQLTTPSFALQVETDLEHQYQAALENRAELQSYKINQEMLETNLQMEKRSFWPNLILLGSYSWKGDTLSLEDGSWTITANASMNLFDGGISREKQVGLEIQLEKLAQTQENLAEMVRFDVEEALLKMEETAADLEIKELSLEYAQENLTVASASYEAGVGSNMEVMNAQMAQQQAELGFVQARYQYQLSTYKLLYKTGRLMEYLEEVIKGEK